MHCRSRVALINMAHRPGIFVAHITWGNISHYISSSGGPRLFFLPLASNSNTTLRLLGYLMYWATGEWQGDRSRPGMPCRQHVPTRQSWFIYFLMKVFGYRNIMENDRCKIWCDVDGVSLHVSLHFTTNGTELIAALVFLKNKRRGVTRWGGFRRKLSPQPDMIDKVPYVIIRSAILISFLYPFLVLLLR